MIYKNYNSSSLRNAARNKFLNQQSHLLQILRDKNDWQVSSTNNDAASLSTQALALALATPFQEATTLIQIQHLSQGDVDVGFKTLSTAGCTIRHNL